MLIVDIPSAVYEVPRSWDGKTRTKKLINVPPIHLEMEHSLLSISKWESKWKIPFVEHPNLTAEQFLDYCRCMTINKQKDPNVYQYLRKQDALKISNYMADPMSARKIQQKKGGGRSRMIMSSEYFYGIMIQLGIPFECEKWHFGRLMALIDCCQAQNGDGGKPMSYRERQKYYSELNAQRRKMLGTKG